MAKFKSIDGVKIKLTNEEEIKLNEQEAKMEEEHKKYQAEYDANQYQRDRVYPSIQEQLDMQYWDNVNGTTNWEDAIAKVKADTPKP